MFNNEITDSSYVEAGKYAASGYISSPEQAATYFNACVRDKVRSGVRLNQAVNMEKNNILDYAAQRLDMDVHQRMSQWLETVNY